LNISDFCGEQAVTKSTCTTINTFLQEYVERINALDFFARALTQLDTHYSLILENNNSKITRFKNVTKLIFK